MVGEIKLYAGITAPSGWLLCQGQILAVSSFPDLYNVIGNAYGGTPGSSFQLPDGRGRVVIGEGAGPGLTARARGDVGGSELTGTAATGTDFDASGMPPFFVANWIIQFAE